MADLLTTIENDVKVAWRDVETFVEDDAVKVWNAVKYVFLGLLPSEWNAIVDMLNQLEADVLAGDIGDIETALLNKAEANAVAWVSALGSGILQAVIAIFKVNIASVKIPVVANTAANTGA